MIITILHTTIIILLIGAVVRLFLTDYLRLREKEEVKALLMEVSLNAQLFDIVVLIVLALIV